MTSNYIAPRKKNDTPDGENISELKSLGPHYSSEKHNVYVKALSKAVQRNGVTNIALSGPYGVGKSSILQGFRKHHPGAIFISLSTLGFSKSVSPNTSKLAEGSISPQTNQIQKEIVKQLLYRRRPSSLPASRFKRIQKPDWKHSLAVSMLIAFALTIVIAAIGGFSKMPKICDSSWREFGVKFVSLWLLLSLATWLASKYLQGVVHIDKFTAGPATLTLSGSDKGNGESYFDRYLDEIIYFFEMSTCRIVVFEDIDRFGNSEIFEELRELNTLLNNAEQLRNKRTGSGETEIVFIYAMKDSIFESQAVADTGEVAKDIQDRAIEEIQRTNRTKFFDVIIPVVPFVTHRSARDVMRQELAGVEPKVSDELIDRVAKYVPDFRLLRSVCNEYTIYAEFILRGNNLKLEPDKLFALMLYKSIHLNDFEKIHLGQSKLDEVYKKSVQVVEGRIRALDDEYDALEKQLDPRFASEMRGAAFKEMIGWLAARTSTSAESFTVNVGSQAFSSEETTTPQFWMAVHRLKTTDSIITDVYNQYGHQRPFELTKLDMAKLMSHDLVFAPLDERPRNVIDSELQRLEIARQKYRSAHMSDLMSDPLAMVPLDDTSQPFAAYVRKMLGSELAAALIRHSYIDQNFVLYTSTYHVTSLSANAMTFRLQHMEQSEMNVNYLLSAEDVRQLLSDSTIEPKEFACQGAYNVAILNYLLLNKDKYRGHFEAVIGSILKDSNNADILLQAFFTSDTPNYNQISLIDELAPRCPRIFDVLVGLRGVPDDQQVGYVDVALRSVSSDTDYDTSLLKEFVEQHYKAMTTFMNPVADKTVDTLTALMSQAGVKFSDISQIDSKLREHLIENGCYEVNGHNLEFVSGDNQEALDVLSWNRPSVYAYLLRSLEAYFAILAEDKSGKFSALVGSADTAKVVADVVKLDVGANTRSEDSVADDANLGDIEAFPLLSNLLASSGGDWSIDLDGLPSSCWPMLAAHDRLAVTTSNLWPYVSKRGVDDDLIELLEWHSAIENQGDALSNEEYIELATAILGLKEEQISAKQRVMLVASIGYSEPIPASYITAQEGKLIGYLLEAGLIADDPAAYELTKEFDWPSREFAIASSQRFADYMEVNLVGDDTLAIVQSQLVPAEVKQNIIDNISSYCSGMDIEDLTSLTKSVTAQQELRTDRAALTWLVEREVKDDVIVPLVARELDSLSDSDVRDIMATLGRPYCDLLAKGATRVYIDITVGANSLLERLKTAGEVTTFIKDGKKRRYTVYRHR